MDANDVEENGRPGACHNGKPSIRGKTSNVKIYYSPLMSIHKRILIYKLGLILLAMSCTVALADTAQELTNSSDPADRQFQHLIEVKGPAAALDFAAASAKASPKSLKAHQRLFLAYHMLGKNTEALTESQTLLDLSGNANWALYDHALALQTNGLTALALKFYEQILAKNIGDADAQLGRAQCLMALGKKREATEALEQLAKTHPNDANAMMNLAAAYLSFGDVAGAEDAAQKAMLLNPKSGQSVRILTLARLQQMDYDGALESALKLIAIDPQNPDGYIFAARVNFARQGDAQVESRLLDRAAAHRLGQAEPFLTMGDMFSERVQSYMSSNRVKDAVPWIQLARRSYDLALPADPQNIHVRLALAKLLIDLKEYGAATNQAALVLTQDARNRDAQAIVKMYGHAQENDLARRMKELLRVQ